MTAPIVQSVRKNIVKNTEIVYCRAYRSTAQDNLTGNSANKINLNAVDSDNGANFDTTNFKFVAPVTGLYQIIASVTFTSVVTDKRYTTHIYKNNASVRDMSGHAGLADTLSVGCVDELFLRKDDYIELYATPQVGGGVDTVDVGTGSTGSVLIVRLVTKEGVRQ